MERVVPNPDNIFPNDRANKAVAELERAYYASHGHKPRPPFVAPMESSETMHSHAVKIKETSYGANGDVTIILDNGVAVTVSIKAAD